MQPGCIYRTMRTLHKSEKHGLQTKKVYIEADDLSKKSVIGNGRKKYSMLRTSHSVRLRVLNLF